MLAVWLTGAIVLGLLRPVRSNDPVEVLPESRLTLPALFLIPLLTPPLSAFGERAGLVILPGGAGLRWSGVLLAAAGYALRIAAMARLGSRFSPLIAVQRSHSLETRGIYTRIRHPGYLGAWIAMLGSLVAFGSAIALPLAALMLIVLHSRVKCEEVVLERRFGEQYRAYRKHSGGLFPRFGPRRSEPSAARGATHGSEGGESRVHRR